MTLPTPERAEYLRSLLPMVTWSAANWRGPCFCNAPADKADDIAEAMEFVGALIDSREPITDGTGRIALFSRGYWAHGF